MSVTYQNDAPRHNISSGRERYLAYGERLMVVVFDFNDGPGEQPDAPHSHPHEQITYVAEGRVRFFVGDESYEVGAGDLITVPPDVPHTIQLLTPSARLVDTFSPIRQDFL
jgi:quercetin dioxygenase-like cupin family protein